MTELSPFSKMENTEPKYNLGSCTLGVVLGPGVLISSKSLLETDHPRPHPIPTMLESAL